MGRFSRLLATLLLATFFLAPLSCRCGPSNVAAVVNGQKIYMSQVDAELKNLKSRHKEMFTSAQSEETEKLFKSRILDELINQVLILQEAKKHKIKVTSEEIEARFKRVEAMFKTPQAFQQALKGQGWTEKEVKENIRQQLLIKRMTDEVTKNVKVTDAEIKAYYEKNSDKFKQSPMVKARHILVRTKPEAEKILRELRAGADFAGLAKVYSTDMATKDSGGDLGWKTREEFVPEFANVAFKLKTGQVSGVVKTQFGYHIIKVEGVKTSKAKSLKEVRGDIEKTLLEEKKSQAFRAWLAEVKAKADIKKYI